MDLELKYLTSFDAVAREGSILRASKELHLTQPAVSYHIQSLERSLGLVLFERVGRRLVLTDAGSQLKSFCREFMGRWEELRSALKLDSAKGSPVVKIAAASTVGRYVLLPILMKGAGDQTRINLAYKDADEIFRLVEAGEFDIGVAAATKATPTLVFEHLCDEEFVLVCSKSFKCHTKKLCDIGFYETTSFVTYEEGDFVFARWFDKLFGRRARILASRWHFDEIEDVLSAVARGYGLSIVPRHAISAHPDISRLRMLRPAKMPRATNALYMVTRNSNFMAPAVTHIKGLIEHQIVFDKGVIATSK
jgi:DNA-binding transcriptional LysR family regulator